MFRTTLVVVAAIACTQARPQFLPNSSGTSNSGITKGETIIPGGGVSTISQQQAATGGQAANGGFNTGSAGTSTQNQAGLLGGSSTSNTFANSNQGSSPVLGGIGGVGGIPSLPVLPGFGLSNSQGHAASGVTKGETISPFGGSTTITQQQAGAGGQAANGGFSTGSAGSNTQSQTGLLGSGSTSNTFANSNQGSLGQLGSGPILPSIPVIGFGPSNAQGQSSSTVTKGETFNPFGGSSTIKQQQASTGGQAVGGGVNTGSASSNTQDINTPFGSSSTSNTNAQSNQFSNPALVGFGGVPGFPVIPGFGSATGNAGSQLTEGKTTGPDGSQTTITQLGSSAGGSAQGGGTSVNQASGSTSTTSNAGGTQSQSNLNSQSTQTGR